MKGEKAQNELYIMKNSYFLSQPHQAFFWPKFIIADIFPFFLFWPSYFPKGILGPGKASRFTTFFLYFGLPYYWAFTPRAFLGFISPIFRFFPKTEPVETGWCLSPHFLYPMWASREALLLIWEGQFSKAGYHSQDLKL